MGGTDKKPENTGTWALFESGDCKLVHASLHSAGKDRGRPVDGYVVTEGQGDFTRSARRAAQAVYAYAKKYFPAGGPVSVAYDLEGLSSGVTLAGESAGLAFAIALAKRIYNDNPGPVAATGEIIGGADSETVGPVRGIAAKLEAAIGVLPEGGWIFCPKANEAEIEDTLRERINEKGLKLKAVSNVSEAIDALFPSMETQKRSKGLWVGVCIALLCTAAAGAFWFKAQYPSAINETVSTVTSTTDTIHQVTSTTVTTPQETSVPTTVKEPVYKKPVTISLTGDTFFTQKLAERLTDRLKAFLKQLYPEAVLTLSGAVSTEKITEETDSVTGGLKTKVGVVVKDLMIDVDGQIKSFDQLSVHIKGPGSAASLMPAAVDRLFEDISDRISNRKEKNVSPQPKKKKIKSGKGFE